MRDDIEKIKDDLAALHKRLESYINSCEHINAKFFEGQTSGSYYEKSEKYIYLSCLDCGTNKTVYEYDKEYKKFLERL